MTESISYSQILNALTTLVNEKANGVLYIHSDCNHAFTIALGDGVIGAIYCGGNRGRKAIPLLSSISAGSYRFDKADLGETTQDLPSTEEILNQLSKPDSATDSVPSSAPPTNEKRVINEESKTLLCQELKSVLTEYIGPIADMVFDDVADEVGDFCATPRLIQSLIEKLAEEIEDIEEKDRFKNKAYRTAKSILKK